MAPEDDWFADVENYLWAVDSDEQPILRGMVRAFADTVANPWIGRGFRSLLLEAGFVEVTVELRSLVFTSYADAAPMMKAMTHQSFACRDALVAPATSPTLSFALT